MFGLIIFLVVNTANVAEPAAAKGDKKQVGMWLELTDTKGQNIAFASTDQPINITSSLSSADGLYDLPFVVVVQALDKRGVIDFLQLRSSELFKEGVSTTTIFWQPDKVGKYELKVFAISNLTNPEVLTYYRTYEVSVLKPCVEPDCRIVGNDANYRKDYGSVGKARSGLIKQEAFTGLFANKADDNCRELPHKRCTFYKLDNMTVYAGADNLDDHMGYYTIREIMPGSFDTENLDEFVGHRVEIIGKKVSMGIKGYQLEEIWPVRIEKLD